MPNPDSLGYVVDGVCDGIGDIFRFIAMLFLLQRYLSNGARLTSLTSLTNNNILLYLFSKSTCGSNYHYLPLTDQPGNTRKGRLSYICAKYKKPFLIMLCVGLQFLLSSFLWNHFMFHYHILLETDILGNSTAVLVTQNQILKSSSMWIVSYFWRLVNPQTMTQYQLLALLYSRECELVREIFFCGLIFYVFF